MTNSLFYYRLTDNINIVYKSPAFPLVQILKVYEGTTLKNRAYVTLVHNMPPVLTNDLILII
jgi:hypothetical protein